MRPIIVYTYIEMVRATKTAPVASASTAPATPVADSSAPVVTKKVAAPKKEKAVAAAPVAVVAPVSVEPVVATTPAVESTTSSAAKFNEINAKIQQLTSVLNTLKNELKSLEKLVVREQKLAQKKSKGTRSASGNRAPSGFVKPTRISDELASFLGKTAGTEMARTDVSREINNYIVKNSLQLQTNRRVITPDSKLSALLKLKSGDEQLTYFNLQRYMKHHFIKAEQSV